MAHVTTWGNTTPHTVKFRIFKGPGQRGAAYEKYEIPAGSELAIAGEHDEAIQTTHRGVVVGGLAPQLTRKGAEKLPVHASILDAAAQGDLERATAGRRAGTPISLDAVEGLTRRLEKVEGGGAESIAAAKKEADEAKARADAAEKALEALKAQLEAQAAPKANGSRGAAPKATPPSMPES